MKTLNSPLTAADLCRANQWFPGTRLVGDEGHGPTVIEITAIGERLLIAKRISHNGNTQTWGESTWTLRHREWTVTK